MKKKKDVLISIHACDCYKPETDSRVVSAPDPALEKSFSQVHGGSRAETNSLYINYIIISLAFQTIPGPCLPPPLLLPAMMSLRGRGVAHVQHPSPISPSPWSNTKSSTRFPSPSTAWALTPVGPLVHRRESHESHVIIM